MPALPQTTVNATFEVFGEIDGTVAPAWLIALGKTTGAVKVATDQIKLVVNGNRYQIESTASGSGTLAKLIDRLDLKSVGTLQATRRSEGRWVSGAQATTHFTEKRGSGEPATAVLDYRKGVVTFSRGDKQSKTEPLKYIASDTLALPFVFYQRPRPSGPVSLVYTDGRRLKTAVFDGTTPFAHPVAGESVPTVRYIARRATPRDPEVEIWVREADGFPIRVRIGLSAKYGARAEANVVKLPPLSPQP